MPDHFGLQVRHERRANLRLSIEFPYKQITVTVGAEFLGRFVVEKLKAHAGAEVFVPRCSEYNLGLAKKIMLVQSQSYREQYGFNSIFLLPANLYGPGDHFDLESSHVIPALIRKCVTARRSHAGFIDVWGSGKASREFLYVEDCAEGIVRSAQYYNKSDPVNLGNGREVAIKDLVELIAKLTGFEGDVRWQTGRPDGQPRRRLETSRASELFGFTALTSLEQ